MKVLIFISLIFQFAFSALGFNLASQTNWEIIEQENNRFLKSLGISYQYNARKTQNKTEIRECLNHPTLDCSNKISMQYYLLDQGAIALEKLLSKQSTPYQYQNGKAMFLLGEIYLGIAEFCLVKNAWKWYKQSSDIFKKLYKLYPQKPIYGIWASLAMGQHASMRNIVDGQISWAFEAIEGNNLMNKIGKSKIINKEETFYPLFMDATFNIQADGKPFISASREKGLKEYQHLIQQYPNNLITYFNLNRYYVEFEPNKVKALEQLSRIKNKIKAYHNTSDIIHRMQHDFYHVQKGETLLDITYLNVRTPKSASKQEAQKVLSLIQKHLSLYPRSFRALILEYQALKTLNENQKACLVARWAERAYPGRGQVYNTANWIKKC